MCMRILPRYYEPATVAELEALVTNAHAKGQKYVKICVPCGGIYVSEHESMGG